MNDEDVITLASRRAFHHETCTGRCAVTHYSVNGQPRVALGVIAPGEPDTAVIMSPAHARKIARSLLHAADAAKRLAE